MRKDKSQSEATGLICSWCAKEFIKEHGYPVLCEACFSGAPELARGLSLQKASIKLLDKERIPMPDSVVEPAKSISALVEEAAPVSLADLSPILASYYDIQGERIATQNRISAYKRGVSTQDESVVALFNEIVSSQVKLERRIKSTVAAKLRDIPLWEEWLKDVKGIGPIITANLMNGIGDISKFATISKVWRYCGMAVVEGRAERATKGQKMHFSPRMKALMFLIGESFVKTKGGYRKIYEDCRAEYAEKWLTPEDCGSTGCKNKGGGKCMAGHQNNAAKRKTVKIFLAHLFQVWNELEGREVRDVFIIGRHDHKGNRHSHTIPVVRE